MKNIVGALIIACSMYSRIPMPKVDWSKERMRYAMCFFPVVGAVTGGAVTVFGILAGRLGLSQLTRSCIGVVIPLVITGGIHMDGFLDVTDARSSYGDREKKLEILKDPHVGAFAILGCGIYLLLYGAAFAELPDWMLPVFGVTFVITRAFSGLAVVAFPKAKTSGLAASFSRQAEGRAVVWSMVVWIVAAAAGICLLGAQYGGSIAGVTLAVLCPAASGIVFYWYYRMSLKEFGGITGDLAGYFLQVCELVLLTVLAAAGRLLS